MRSLVVGAMVAGMMVAGSLAQAEDMAIAKGKKVTFDYTLTVENKVVESTNGKKALVYNHGEGMLIPGLEKELEGMKAGETKKVVVKPEDGYGPVNPQLVREFERSKLPTDVKPEKGMLLEMTDQQGNAYPAIISEVKDKSVVLDFNHILAGKELTFDVKIVSVEDGSAAAAPAAGEKK